MRPLCQSRRGPVRAWSFLLAGLFAAGLGSVLWACGPFFPNSLLLSGDDAILQAPTTRFLSELDRLQLEPPPGLVHAKSDASERESTLAAEITDLRHALALQQVGTNKAAEMVLALSRRRADLEEHLRKFDRWQRANPEPPWLLQMGNKAESKDSDPPPRWVDTRLPDPIPGEFDLYLRGAVAWHEGANEDARAAWESLLALPPAARRFKSTWAAFMLGRSWHDEDPARATRYYESTRKLARSGLADSAGLAVASLGWEGQLKLRTNDLAGALRLYLDQYAAGSTVGSGLSLQVAAERVLAAPAEIRVGVARDPIARRVITAWLLASRGPYALDLPPESDPPGMTEVRAWLETLETVGAAEVALAEQLAVLHYRLGDWEAAGRWIELSGDSPVAEWIQAKLLMRDGKLGESAEAYSRVLARLPLTPPERVRYEPPEFVDSLADPQDGIPARRMVLGESGVLHLTRGEFVQALDALLRAGYWQDAAYVAERVLTLPELRAYVDSHWPDTARGGGATSVDRQATHSDPESSHRRNIRYLLGRRLTRSNQGPEATPYFPTEWRESHRSFLTQLRRGEDSSLPPLDRAQGWYAAAWIARTNGLELLGTEVAPDWAIWDGQYEWGPDHSGRSSTAGKRLRPTPTELTRARAHTADPEARFHYRYQAAFLAWDASLWMPNNDPETATMLYSAGQWLKGRDPKTADLFYKALVRRCRGTELGDAADRQRWFPDLDATGKPIVTRKP
ncbi:MAG: hypothetical protein AB7O66_06440 [Limisphaerales bacterium]